MDELLAIGDFAARCGLSAKMLRSYAAVGLLVPAVVDPWSGYRYYATNQLPQARVIALLRHAGIAVDDIAGFFEHPDVLAFDRWDRELMRDSRARRQALAQARAALAVGHAPSRAQPETSGKDSHMAHNFRTGAATAIGGRATNQDAVHVGNWLFAVADGFGGLHDGEVASRLALDTLDVTFAADGSVSGLLNACREANRAVWRQASDKGEDATMGTTLAALAVTSDVAVVVVQVGDSRLYRFRHAHLEALTRDHSVVGGLIRAGALREEDARAHPHWGLLTRALGVGPVVDVDHAGVSCEPGDRLVLCTDGLFNVLSSEEMTGVVGSHAQAQHCADRLVASAVERGAPDNVTALVVDLADAA
ncbi:MAG: MerR family transcriptional regulator [Sciscionella sp.]